MQRRGDGSVERTLPFWSEWARLGWKYLRCIGRGWGRSCASVERWDCLYSMLVEILPYANHKPRFSWLRFFTRIPATIISTFGCPKDVHQLSSPREATSPGNPLEAGRISLREFDAGIHACVFQIDGVICATWNITLAAWKRPQTEHRPLWSKFRWGFAALEYDSSRAIRCNDKSSLCGRLPSGCPRSRVWNCASCGIVFDRQFVENQKRLAKKKKKKTYNKNNNNKSNHKATENGVKIPDQIHFLL